MTEERPPALTGNPAEVKSEGQMVLETLAMFQEQMHAMDERYKRMETVVQALNDRVNKEFPAQLDAAFNEIRQNFVQVGNSLRILQGQQPNSALANATATGGQQQKNPIGEFMQELMKGITGSGKEAAAGGLTDMDKQILQASKQIQLLNLKDVLKKTARSAGVDLTEHMVLSE
jgi:hypothetical protein